MTTTKTENDDLHYVGEGTRWFMDYLPKQIFDSLGREKSKYYREYRRRQRNIGDSNLKIDEVQKKIDKLNKIIREEKKKQKDWYSKLKMYYDEISGLDINFRFSCTVEFRKRTSRKKGDEPYVYLYSHIITNRHRVSIYLGNEKVVRVQLGELYGEDFFEYDKDELKDEIKSLIRPWGRYHIHKKGWNGMSKIKSMNLEEVIKWVNKVGWDEISKWGKIDNRKMISKKSK